jgi:class 3 adenylate cyclase
MGSDLGGIAVHIGARIAGLAQSGEVLVSTTVKDLVAGSALHFQDRGVYSLKGIPGDWRLFAVDH